MIHITSQANHTRLKLFIFRFHPKKRIAVHIKTQ